MNIKKLVLVFVILTALAVSTASCSRLGLGSNEVSYSTIVVPPDMAEKMEQNLVAAIEPYMSPDVIIKGTMEVDVLRVDEPFSTEPTPREAVQKYDEFTTETFVTFKYPTGTKYDAEIQRALNHHPPRTFGRVIRSLFHSLTKRL